MKGLNEPQVTVWQDFLKEHQSLGALSSEEASNAQPQPPATIITVAGHVSLQRWRQLSAVRFSFDRQLPSFARFLRIQTIIPTQNRHIDNRTHCDYSELHSLWNFRSVKAEIEHFQWAAGESEAAVYSSFDLRDSQKMATTDATLHLEDGSTYSGTLFGANTCVSGEVGQ